MRRAQRLAFVAVATVSAVLLSGCTYVNRTAARLNPDGSIEFATCDARPFDSIETEWSYGPSSTATPEPVGSTPVAGIVAQGDVFHLDVVAPSDEWQNVSIRGIGPESPVSGWFSADDLAGGDWVWNQTSVFLVGARDVEHCELDEANAR